jgi:hypothetical protein
VADQMVQLVSDATNTGKKVDTSEITVGANTVQRQRIVLADDTTTTALAKVIDGQLAPALTDDALVVQLSPNSPVTLAKFRDLGTQQNVKSSPGTLFGVQILNNGVADCYVQMFNASGAVTLGTEEPVLEFRVPAGQQQNVPIPDRGIAFTTGIRVASTTAEKGSSASAAGVMVFAQYV